MRKPEQSEYPSYYNQYIDLVKGENVIKELQDQIVSMQVFLATVPENQEDFSYAPGKWTLKEVIGHIIDTERIMAYRVLRFARGDNKVLQGFEEDEYVKAANFHKRTLYDLAHEFGLVRESNLCLFKTLDEGALSRRGMANDKEISVRALIHTIAGHTTHHLNVVRTKYLIMIEDED